MPQVQPLPSPRQVCRKPPTSSSPSAIPLIPPLVPVAMAHKKGFLDVFSDSLKDNPQEMAQENFKTY